MVPTFPEQWLGGENSERSHFAETIYHANAGTMLHFTAKTIEDKDNGHEH
jgi:adenosyl cobinamide kinase/adenosyl cobinamide phosphate guanylyltransferase